MRGTPKVLKEHNDSPRTAATDEQSFFYDMFTGLQKIEHSLRLY